MTFWDFWNQHWFLAWCALWLGWGVYFIVISVLITVRRLVRSLMVCVRGWPPAHLDADGDFRPEPKEADK